MDYNLSTILIITFLITGFWDILLQIYSNYYDTLPTILKWFKDPKILQPYFKHHTILSAFLLAAFAGAIAQFFILKVHKLPTKSNDVYSYLLVTFIISGIVGLFMQYSGLYPILDETYYKHLGKINGFIHDGISGLIVQITLLVILYYYK